MDPPSPSGRALAAVEAIVAGLSSSYLNARKDAKAKPSQGRC